MRLSWHSNAGTFADDRTGRSETEADQASTVNTWTAPNEAREVTIWAVPRDSRSGSGWQSYRITVQ